MVRSSVKGRLVNAVNTSQPKVKNSGIGLSFPSDAAEVSFSSEELLPLPLLLCNARTELPPEPSAEDDEYDSLSESELSAGLAPHHMTAHPMLTRPGHGVAIPANDYNS
eukprot:2072529-Amphidinium_carterae.1